MRTTVFLKTVLLSFLHTWVTCKESCSLEWSTVFRVCFQKCSCNSVTDCLCLSCEASAFDIYKYVVVTFCFCYCVRPVQVKDQNFELKVTNGRELCRECGDVTAHRM